MEMHQSTKVVPPKLIGMFLIITIGIGVSFLMSSATMTNAIGLSLALIMFALAFLRTEVALYLLIFSMLLSPEINFGAMDETGVSGGRSVVIRLDDLFMLLMAFGWLAKNAVIKSMGMIEKSPLNGRIYLYTAAFVLATGAGILYGDVEALLGIFNVIKFIQYFILYFLVLNNIDSLDRAKSLMRTAIWVSVIIYIYALIQVPSGNRVSAPFEGEGGEPNTLGGYIVLMISITLALFLETYELRKRILFGAISGLGMIALLYTESRSSYIGMFLSVAVLIFFVRRRNLLLLCVVITVIFSSVLLPSRVIQRIAYTFEGDVQSDNPFGGNSRAVDTSTEARLRSWVEAFDGWRKYPILGYGVTGFWFIDAQYMKVLVETGAVGLVTFFLLLKKIGNETKRMMKYVKRKDEFLYSVTIGFYAGFIGLCGHALGTNTFIIIRIMEPFWLIAGIIMSIPKVLPESAVLVSGEETDDENEILQSDEEPEPPEEEEDEIDKLLKNI